MSVYQAILGVMDDLAKVGISKDRTNQQQHFAYRGIDDVRDAVAPCLVKNRLIILPQVISREMLERQSKNGGALFYVTLKVEYEFLSVDDGSNKLVGPFFGEAMDSSDKATNKAMSAAYKLMCIETFCVRTKGEEAATDADATVHDVAPVAAPSVTSESVAVIQTSWDGTKKVGFSKLFRASAWAEVPQEFLNWCNGEGAGKLNALQLESAQLEQQRRDRVCAELSQDIPESFYASPKTEAPVA